MSDIPSLQFAIQASDHLLHVADGLCADTSCVQFCATLKTILVDIIKWLRALPDDEHSKGEAVALLEELESLCQPRGSPAQTDESRTTPPVPKPPYTALTQLLTNTEAATLAIRDLASDEMSQRQRRKTLAGLGSYLPPTSDDDKVDVSPSNADLQAASTEPPECGKEIASLHKTLFTYCFCSQDDACGEMVARIRLHGNVQDDTGVTFGVLFMAHPHQDAADLESQPWWQDTHISVLRLVKFKAEKSSEGAEIRLDSDMPFCSLISGQDESGVYLLYLSVTGEKLFFEKAQDPARQWEFKSPSISLGRLLERVYANDLTEKRKEVLSWILAKAVWQYYSSPWMLQPWNKESVHFLFERRRTDQGHEVAGIFVNEPLLSVSILPDKFGVEHTKAGSEPEEGTKSGPKTRRPFHFVRKQIPLHQIPKILGLGVMLIEIQLGRSMESLRSEPEWSQYCPQGKQNINTNYNICKDLTKKPNFFADMEISDPLEALIKSCIQPQDYFMPHVRDEERIRERLYVLVNRLEVYISKRKPHNVKPLSLPRSLPSTCPPPTPTPQPAPQPQHLPLAKLRKPPWPGRTMAQITNSTSTEGWFKRMASVNYILKAADGDIYDRVKIAVLDTGVDSRDVAADYVSGYRDFVSENNSVKCDSTGHGTTSVNLVFDICESADVYAVRIFETDKENNTTQELAIKAIDWCIKENMDIICMACGFHEHNQDFFDKIHQASGKVLIFAAPTNESNAGEIAYPARYYDQVFCMFSTNSAVTNSRRINPTKGLAKNNFAILGEDIRTHSGEQKSGTSFSTAIAAGLAGRLLDFSRHGDSQGKIEGAFKMKGKLGMTRLLHAIMESDEPYCCIKPWKLLPYGLRNQVPFAESPTDMERVKARLHICNIIAQSVAEV